MTLVMSSLFSVTGVTLTFLPRWLEVERGLSGVEIGLVLSLAQLARVFTGPAIGFWADGVADKGAPLRICAVATLAAYIAFFFLAHSFATLLITGFVALSLMQAMVPLVEAATLRATTNGAFSYGVARGIGSVAFIVANIAGGVIAARFGVGAIVAWVLTWVVLSAGAAFNLRSDSHDAIEAPSAVERVAAVRTLLHTQRFVVLIVACGLIQSGHAFYYSFSTIVWRGQGVPAETVGVLWAFGVAAEVAFLWNLTAVERRVSPEVLILIGAAGGVLRWSCMGFAPLGVALWPLQALHAATFAAAHVGAMRLIYREAPAGSAAMAQTLYAAISGGILMGMCTLLSGALYDAVGAAGYWAMALIAAAGGALSLLLMPPSQRTAPSIHR